MPGNPCSQLVRDVHQLNAGASLVFHNCHPDCGGRVVSVGSSDLSWCYLRLVSVNGHLVTIATEARLRDTAVGHHSNTI